MPRTSQARCGLLATVLSDVTTQEAHQTGCKNDAHRSSAHLGPKILYAVHGQYPGNAEPRKYGQILW